MDDPPSPMTRHIRHVTCRSEQARWPAASANEHTNGPRIWNVRIAPIVTNRGPEPIPGIGSRSPEAQTRERPACSLGEHLALELTSGIRAPIWPNRPAIAHFKASRTKKRSPFTSEPRAQDEKGPASAEVAGQSTSWHCSVFSVRCLSAPRSRLDPQQVPHISINGQQVSLEEPEPLSKRCLTCSEVLKSKLVCLVKC